MTTECRICGNASGNITHTAREMMLALRHEFQYRECGACGVLQLQTPPRDWTPYYPSDYYSFHRHSDGFVKRYLKRIRAKHALGRKSWLGQKLVDRWGVPPFVDWLTPTRIGFHDRILDVGCGTGQLLGEMAEAGFTRLAGIDPYIEHDLVLSHGVRIAKRELKDETGEYDLIMLNHAFEHLEQPQSALREIARLLPAGKLALIRIPVAGCFAWRTYGVNWVQLDAPRHWFLHTRKSLEILAQSSGFVVEHVHYDSTAFQFWASEQYQSNIPLYDPKSYLVNPSASGFSTERIEEWSRKASELNARQDGDQACFYLRRVGNL